MYALNYVKAKSVKEAADFLAANPEAASFGCAP